MAVGYSKRILDLRRLFWVSSGRAYTVEGSTLFPAGSSAGGKPNISTYYAE